MKSTNGIEWYNTDIYTFIMYIVDVKAMKENNNKIIVGEAWADNWNVFYLPR